MHRSVAIVGFLAAAAAAGMLTARAQGQDASPLAGVWTLNRALSELPRDIGFNPAWFSAPNEGDENAGSGGAGRGRRGAGGGGGSTRPFSTRQESYEDAQRTKVLTDDARNPPARLTVIDAPTGFTVTNELGQSHTFHPDGREESIDVAGVSVPVTTRRDRGRVVVVYRATQDREVLYTYSRSADPQQLVVDVQFLEHGAGLKARRVYEPGIAADAGASSSRAGTVPPAQAAPELDQRPNAELNGLNTLGIVVEDLSDSAAACGLKRDAIEAALSKQLADGGFTVHKYSDDDTYLYVNVMTANLSSATCVSRYDAFLYTHAATKLPYHDRAVLVQVLLLHRGGMGSSAVAAHAAAVMRGLQNFVAVFINQIQDANK